MLMPAGRKLLPMSEDLGRVLRWNVWANRQVLDTLRASNGEPGNALAAFQHVFEAELTWLRRIAGYEPANVPLWGDCSLAQCEQWFEEAAERCRQQRTGDTAREFSYRNSTGKEFRGPVIDALLQLLMHSSQYRGEASGFLNAAGHRVPDLDYIFWLRIGEPD
ncbi:hypothetical protein AYO38_10680 [bacterium SCGC AG-212-C10]|nr:hypothetical protein AYO38_10680 [bacterium SCGC AG-212-C10]